MSTNESVKVRAVDPDDFKAWLPLWEGYNTFYGRTGSTALADTITSSTWARFFNPMEPIFALVAEQDNELLGVAHYLFHRSTSVIGPVCYLQDLFTVPKARCQGIGKRLIEAVIVQARLTGAERLYWHTQESNDVARHLYNKIAKHVGFIVYSLEVGPLT